MSTDTRPISRWARRHRASDCPVQSSDADLLRQFTAKRDEAAFRALVGRHGTMVFDVCRNVLHNEPDAEDAFQATFLVLAQKARTIRKQGALASWLYGVAHRTACRARENAERRQKHEKAAPDRSQVLPGDELSWREVQAVLHEELSQISDRYRAPLVLCYLEGKTQDEAALELGVVKDTVKKRLERGRALLRVRLMRRGLGSVAVLLAASWPLAQASAMPSAATISALTQAAALTAARHTAAGGLISTKVAALSQDVLKTMLFLKLTTLAARLVVAGLLAATAVVAGVQVLPGTVQFRQVVIQDFRQGKPLVAGLALTGKDVHQFLKREAEGYRFTLPAGRKVEGYQQGVGVQATIQIQGDFQITGRYELFAAEAPARKMMVAGVEIFLMRGPDGKRQARLGRFNTTEGSLYEVRDSDFTPPRKPKPTQIYRFPAQDHQGQLRLRREGARLSYLVNDATTNETFKELFHADFGSEPLTVVLFGITPGMDLKRVEGRLLDLRIESEGKQTEAGLPPVQRPEQPHADPEPTTAQLRPADPPRDPAGPRWPIFLMIAVLILLGAGGLLALFRLQRRNRKNEAAAAVVQLSPSAVAPFLTFTCSLCGKRLKSRAALAGQKVKCPQCGKAVAVPG